MLVWSQGFYSESAFCLSFYCICTPCRLIVRTLLPDDFSTNGDSISFDKVLVFALFYKSILFSSSSGEFFDHIARSPCQEVFDSRTASDH